MISMIIGMCLLFIINILSIVPQFIKVYSPIVQIDNKSPIDEGVLEQAMEYIYHTKSN